MIVYLTSNQSWIDFVNGVQVIAYKNPVENFFKKIIVSPIEVIVTMNDGDRVIIEKKY